MLYVGYACSLSCQSNSSFLTLEHQKSFLQAAMFHRLMKRTTALHYAEASTRRQILDTNTILDSMIFGKDTVLRYIGMIRSVVHSCFWLRAADTNHDLPALAVGNQQSSVRETCEQEHVESQPPFEHGRRWQLQPPAKMQNLLIKIQVCFGGKHTFFRLPFRFFHALQRH